MSEAIEHSRNQRSANLLNTGLIFANALGIALYLVLASRGWRIPEEHGMVPVTGEPFVWAFALPVLGIFVLVDSVWGVVLLMNEKWNGRRLWLLTAAVWFIAIGFDFYHH